MFKLFVTLLRGRNADAAESLTDAAALPILRQQLRDCAAGVETARRAVAMVMAYAERERKAQTRISAQLADLETRALAALAQGRDDSGPRSRRHDCPTRGRSRHHRPRACHL